MAKIRETFAGACADDAQAMDAIKRVFNDTGYLMDPHTAVAWRAAEDYRAQSGDARPCVVLSTASPYKFPMSVLTALGEEVPSDAAAQLRRMEELSGTRVPAPFVGILDREPRFKDVIAPERMMDYVMERMKKA